MRLSLFFDVSISDGGSHHYCLKTIEIFKKNNLKYPLIITNKKIKH